MREVPTSLRKRSCALRNTSLRVCIHADASGGLGTDIQVLSKALAERGHRVWIRGKPAKSMIPRCLPKIATGIEVIRRRVSRISRHPLFDLNLHIETINEHHAHTAVLNVLIPHPEWFMPHNLQHLHLVDLLWAKTHDTSNLLRHLGKPIRFVGFTSLDKGTGHHHKLPSNNLCLHVAGHSHVKGTLALVAAWKQHPEWPNLTIVGDLANGGEEYSKLDFSSHNVRHLKNRILEHDLSRLRSEHAFHVQPSESEGFGHVINEASSCGRVLITTDAPPMNELIQANSGLLVRPIDSTPLNLGFMYRLAPHQLESTISKALLLTEDERRTLGRRLRAGYLLRHSIFMKNLALALGELFPSTSRFDSREES